MESEAPAAIRPHLRALRWLYLLAVLLVLSVGVFLFVLSDDTDTFLRLDDQAAADRGVPGRELLGGALPRVAERARARVGERSPHVRRRRRVHRADRRGDRAAPGQVQLRQRERLAVERRLLRHSAVARAPARAAASAARWGSAAAVSARTVAARGRRRAVRGDARRRRRVVPRAVHLGRALAVDADAAHLARRRRLAAHARRWAGGDPLRA